MWMTQMTGPVRRFPSGTRVSRWPLSVTVLPYALLAFCAILSVVIKGGATDAMLIDLALSALAAVWMLWMFTLHPAWRERTPAMTVFFAGLIVILAVLVIRAPWYGFFTPAGYF